MPNDKSKAYVSLIIPRDLYNRLENMRWEKRAASFAGMVRDLLRDCADQHENEHETPAEMAQSGT